MHAGSSTKKDDSRQVIEAMANLDLVGLSERKSTRNELDTALAREPGMESSFVRGFVLQNCVQHDGTWTWRVGLQELTDAYDGMASWPYSSSTDQIDHEMLVVAGVFV